MPRLAGKILKEAKDGALVVSYRFKFKDSDKAAIHCLTEEDEMSVYMVKR